MQRWLLGVCVLCLSLGACDDEPSLIAPAAAACTPEQPSPYPTGIPYVGVHAGPQNNDLVRCETQDAFHQGWHALQGSVMAQPNTFSPDGTTTYATTSAPMPGACTVHALDVITGEERWCASVPGAVFGSVEVDEDGNLFLAGTGAVISLDATGAERWRLDLPQSDDPEAPLNGSVGVHFDRAGFLVTQTNAGDVLLLDRADGRIVANLDVATTFGFVPVESIGVNIENALPDAITDDFANVSGGGSFSLGVFIGSGGQYTDNTIAISPVDDSIYAVGGGPNGDEGALVQVVRGGTPDAPTLEPGWAMTITGSSASSPAISQDGRWAKIADGNSAMALLSPSRYPANVRLVDIEACNNNTDSDEDPARCAPAISEPLLTGPAVGASPVFDDAEHYVWEIQIADILNTETPDVRAFRGEELLWETLLPDDMQWSAVLTISENHIIGTGTRFTEGDESFLTLEFPATAESEVLVLDRATGDVVFRAPVTDDAAGTVTVGPDGSLFVGMLGLLHGFATETQITGGLIRFVPN